MASTSPPRCSSSRRRRPTTSCSRCRPASPPWRRRPCRCRCRCPCRCPAMCTRRSGW
uniref:Uncharacterized protein n=1 Tax=Arundo donax TaxID=35708 RepID=A0A0A9EFC1_ARUDO